MRNLLAIFLLLIFSIQALPVKLIGKSLVKNQQTEEVKGDCDDDCDDCDDDDLSKEEKYNEVTQHYNIGISFSTPNLKTKRTCYYSNDRLPNSHVRDIHCPPPNC
jgi:hypothetical protein